MQGDSPHRKFFIEINENEERALSIICMRLASGYARRLIHSTLKGFLLVRADGRYNQPLFIPHVV